MPTVYRKDYGPDTITYTAVQTPSGDKFWTADPKGLAATAERLVYEAPRPREDLVALLIADGHHPERVVSGAFFLWHNPELDYDYGKRIAVHNRRGRPQQGDDGAWTYAPKD
jgi:hypothetical protein